MFSKKSLKGTLKKLITWIKANPKTINTISASVLILIALIIIISQQY